MILLSKTFTEKTTNPDEVPISRTVRMREMKCGQILVESRIEWPEGLGEERPWEKHRRFPEAECETAERLYQEMVMQARRAFDDWTD
ncbi:hypothetical protein [Singulisphaera sp. PoT]|uniref:hypothetical protein n=1 Tax=Singulisphaera sp. PoT TaxID=3411797 RepID=UPI003BF51AF6